MATGQMSGSGRGGGGKTRDLTAEGFTITRTDVLKYPDTTSKSVKVYEVTIANAKGASETYRYPVGGMARNRVGSGTEAVERALGELASKYNTKVVNPPKTRIIKQ